MSQRSSEEMDLKQLQDGSKHTNQSTLMRPNTPETLKLSGPISSANLQMKLDDQNCSSNDNSMEAAAGISFSMSSTGVGQAYFRQKNQLG